MRRIAEYVYQAIKNAQQAISAAFNKARAKVERARAAVNRAFDKVNQWKGSKVLIENLLNTIGKLLTIEEMGLLAKVGDHLCLL